MRLWFARNTVLLFEQCYRDLDLKEDSTPEESQAALEKQKKLCEKYKEKEKRLLEICSKEVPESINDEHAPNSDEEYNKAKYIKLLGEYINKFVQDKLELYGTE